MEHVAFILLHPSLVVIAHWIGVHWKTIFGVLAALWAIAAFVLTRNAALYSNFDTLYQKALETSMEHSAFCNPEKTRDYKQSFQADERAAYEAYAYMVLNVCETIADDLNLYDPGEKGILDLAEAVCCWALPPSASRAYLRESWLPVLISEKQIHEAWLNDQKEGIRFKAKFLRLMRNDLPEVVRECAGQSPARPRAKQNVADSHLPDLNVS